MADNKEIERKYLVKYFGKEILEKILSGHYKYIGQSYLVGYGGTALRVRVVKTFKDHQCTHRSGFITVKGAGSLSKDEFEMEIPYQHAKNLINGSDGNLFLQKRRIEVEGIGYTIEVDIFMNLSVDNFTIAEIELSSEEEVPSSLPDWIGEEVTEHKGYSNFSLIQLKEIPESYKHPNLFNPTVLDMWERDDTYGR